ncbi:MAG: carboxypeptidase regulatory-like domain-containing protein [Candidatus Latescibacteria bacterium]|jgi:hypothetical protein|nr:carboxypeptidase regulatory-like domain-containing protein [Candidatus Latescibacterota bacterium]
MRKHFSIPVFVIFLTVIIFLSCDKDKEKSIVGPVEDTFTISGRVFDQKGQPFRNITINLVGSVIKKSKLTGSLGDYSFDGLPVGDYTITPSKEGYRFSPFFAKVRITDSNRNVDDLIGWAVRVNVEIGGIIGKIIDTDKKPVWGVYAQLFPDPDSLENGPLKTSKTNEYGYYSLSYSVFLNNSYKIVPIKEGYNYTFSPDSSYVTPINQITIVNFIALYSGLPLHSISGRIFDIGGNSVNFSPIELTGEEESERYCLSTDKDGFYTFDDLIDGTYILWAPFVFGLPRETIIVDGVDIIMPDLIELNMVAYSAEDYFPIGAGSSWTYERTTDEGEPTDHTVSVTGTETANDKAYTVMSSGYPAYFNSYRIENNTVYVLAEDEDKTFLKFGVRWDSEWVVDSIRGNILTGTFIDIETVSVSAGTFEDCLHFELNLPLGDISYEKTDLWFARDIGLVKAEKVVVSMGEVMETVTDVLKSLDNK